jgi:hypothetical protein
MDPRRGQGFGWAIPVSDGSRRGEAAAAARDVERLWGEFFPQKSGYSVTRAELPGGFRLRVQRGDFLGEVEINSHARERGAQLKMHGWACSQRLAEAERAAARASERLRTIGSLIGASALMAWLSQMFVHPPNFTIDMMFLLGGLLVVVIMLIALAAGANVGAWLGGHVAAVMWGRALAQVDGDAGLREDLERWRALVKNLAHLRDALAGSARRQPFRSDPVAEDPSEPGGVSLEPGIVPL